MPVKPLPPPLPTNDPTDDPISPDEDDDAPLKLSTLSPNDVALLKDGSSDGDEDRGDRGTGADEDFRV